MSPQMVKHRLRKSATVIILGWPMFCAVVLSPSAGRGLEPGQANGGALGSSAREVEYRLEWHWGRAVPALDGPGWSVVNDLGYRVRIVRGYLVSYSMEMVPCPTQSRRRGAGAALWDLLERVVGPRRAHAGHSEMARNPAAVTTPHLESLSEPRASTAAVVRLSAHEYCQVHYLVARADQRTQGLPPDGSPVGTSLLLEGTYRSPGSYWGIPFTIETPMANGVLHDIIPTMSQPEAAADGVRVAIRRNIGALFDGVDFASMSQRQAAYQILRQLIETVEIEVAPTPRVHSETS